MRGWLGLLCFTLFTCACTTLHSEREAYGLYELKYGEGEIRLDVRADHSYSEVFRPAGYPDQRSSGRWHWADGTDGTARVCLDGLLEPIRFRQDLYSASGQSPKVVGRAYQLDECLPAETEYGKTILEINPDSGENFVMIGSDVNHR